MLCSIKRRAQRKSPILVILVVFDLDDRRRNYKYDVSCFLVFFFFLHMPPNVTYK